MPQTVEEHLEELEDSDSESSCSSESSESQAEPPEAEKPPNVAEVGFHSCQWLVHFLLTGSLTIDNSTLIPVWRLRIQLGHHGHVIGSIPVMSDLAQGAFMCVRILC